MYVSIVFRNMNDMAILLIFLFSGMLNLFSWFIVYGYVRELSNEASQIVQNGHETNPTSIQIRYSANGQIDILQDTRELTPGIYAIAPVNNNDRCPTTAFPFGASKSGIVHETIFVYKHSCITSLTHGKYYFYILPFCSH